MLTEMTLFGVRDKVQTAINRIREFCPPEGYYVAFSGGKDSTVVLDLVKRAGVKFDAHYNRTTVDPPELVRFIREQYPDVEERKPEMSMWQLIRKKRMPPTRMVRYCCEYLKEGGGAGRTVITGVRWAESTKRSKRRMVEVCNKKALTSYLHPIIDWTEEDVWEYIRSNNLPYCNLYNKGYKRLGCIGCPLGGYKHMIKEFSDYPGYYKAYLHAFERMLQARQEDGLATDKWETAQDVMDWWIYCKKSEDTDQTILFE